MKHWTISGLLIGEYMIKKIFKIIIYDECFVKSVQSQNKIMNVVSTICKYYYENTVYRNTKYYVFCFFKLTSETKVLKMIVTYNIEKYRR